MPSGSCSSLADLPDEQRDILNEARRGVMATIGRDGCPHAVPVVFAVRDDKLVSPIDHKPKRGVVMARVRNLVRDPSVTLLVDRWDEDWRRIGWIMIRGRAEVIEPDPESGRLLVDRYEQYRDPRYDETSLFDAFIVISPADILWWTYS
jgi:PPOX class probable F420-dependent enzyme